MQRFFLSIRAFFLIAAVLSLLLVTGGCGGGDSATGSSGDSGEVTVETGSLSKAEFITQADTLCKASRAKFDRAFNNRAQGFQSASSSQEQAVWLEGIVDDIFLPTYESLIAKIGSLGAPSADEEQVTAFLLATQEAVDNARENPVDTFDRLTPFNRAIKLATAYGLAGCAESLG